MHRVPPNVEYFEPEPQPAAKRAYTERDIQISITRTVYEQSQEKLEYGSNETRLAGMIKPSKHENRVRIREEGRVSKKGFCNSLRASAKGVREPNKEGLLGPFRNMRYARVFRSSKVKKATANKSESNDKKQAIK